MANRYGVIVVSSNPLGRFDEVIIDGAYKPGICLTLKAATEPATGKFTYEAYNRAASGDRAAICVLRENELQGKGPEDAWLAGQLALVYFPAEGEYLQMLIANIGGTADSHAIGEKLMVEDGTGKLIAATGSDAEPFELLETLAAPTADVLALCKFTGY